MQPAEQSGDRPVPSTGSKDRRIILSAFALHAGGGAVLVREVVSSIGHRVAFATLDWRIRDELAPRLAAEVVAVPSRLLPRLRALIRVARVGREGDRLFCLNSLPPLVRSPAYTIVYVHSAQFAGMMSDIAYPPAVRLRLWLDRLLFAIGRRNIDEIWVQTRTIAAAMAKVAPGVVIRVAPFVDAQTFGGGPRQPRPLPDGDGSFFYPADELDHKNHLALFKAWQILVDGGGRHRLQVTLDDAAFQRLVASAGVGALVGGSIVNVGRLTRADVLSRLELADALIFPSRVETFGLPLVEARARGVPIIAGELDFVRDVCEPVVTFDPRSPVSIARAVLRFSGRADVPPVPETGAAIAALLLGVGPLDRD